MAGRCGMTDDCPIDINKMKPVDLIEGEDALDTKLLKEMAIEARDFISSQEWCEQVDQQYLAFGIGGIVATFLVQITPRSEDVDTLLWVIVGDLPPACIVVPDNPTVADALDAYCSEMEAWVEAVEKSESVDDLIPVNVPPTLDLARALSGRLSYLRSEVLPLSREGNPHSAPS
jgi:hypothetical protein